MPSGFMQRVPWWAAVVAAGLFVGSSAASGPPQWRPSGSPCPCPPSPCPPGGAFVPAPAPVPPAASMPRSPDLVPVPPPVVPAPAVETPVEPILSPAAPPGSGTQLLSLFESSVGYIDPAIPANVLRLRFDAAYDNNRPNRAEFFYARGGGGGNPGPPRLDPRVDYQEVMGYLEVAAAPRLSGFVEVPFRFFNGEVNANSAGLGDMNFGFKFAAVYCADTVLSLQFRTYVPTGDADRALGNDHVSLEPGVLLFRRLSDTLRTEGEVRYWAPVGGTDFAGSIIRYGLGVSYGRRCPDSFWINPVLEFVGWTVLDGKVEGATIEPGMMIRDAAGDTIVNAKLGLRAGLGDVANIYAGYGRPLTGKVWYEDIYRFELRLNY